MGFYAGVFGIDVFAHLDWKYEDFQHFIGLLAQMLDNTMTGCVDDPLITLNIANQ